MKNLILIFILFFSINCKSQSCINFDSLALSIEKELYVKFEKRIEALEEFNEIQEGNKAIYQSQVLLIDAFKEYRHYGLTHFKFGYARFMKFEIKKQESILLTLR